MYLASPLLSDCRRLFLRRYAIDMSIGAYDFEKKGKQRVLVDIDLYIPLSVSTPHNDELAEVVDYDFMRTTLLERVARGHIHLQETLCDDVAHALLCHPHVFAVRVATSKPEAYAHCEAVGVEVFHVKKAPQK